MTTAARQSLPGSRPVGDVPRVDCTADSAGGLTFDITLPGTGERWDAALVLRGAHCPDDPVRLPLVPAGEGVLRAVLPSTMRLPEGRWKAGLILGDSSAVRLGAGRLDLSSLVGRAPYNGLAWLGVRIPYRTQGGGLSVRSWQRWPHAEVSEIAVGEGSLTVHGVLHGAELTSTASLEVRDRGADMAAGAFPVVADGPRFTATLPLRDGPRVPRSATEAAWRLLWLRPARDTPGVRIARLLDDIADKRCIRYPAVPLASGRYGVRPGYTGDNDLALRWERLLPATGEQAGVPVPAVEPPLTAV